jgi:hypothetical protein
VDPKKLQNLLFFNVILILAILTLFYENNSIEDLKDHLNNSEYNEVIEISSELLKKPNLSLAEKKEVYLLKGIAEFSLNQKLNSQLTFAELKILDKKIEFDSTDLSSNIITSFHSMMKELPQDKNTTQ